jgi:O-antigen/teichoic acid export membrane protein
VLGYLKRLVTTGAAYQFGDILAKGLALLTLPLYTHHLAPQAYGAAESLLTAVILSSILLRVGIGEAFIRFYFDDDDVVRRERIARTATAAVAWTTTLAAIAAAAFAGPLSRLLLSFEDPLLLDCAVLGLWAFTNL